ncbi:MAG TPA: wax ester/triacylglycerol synthase domain-containing protein, partial [Kineosporiaceae bacterium]|nr:wax ester/triacylglycerol synthase domain-containing protein [Kineosporiaceae bacterium]
MLEPVRAADLTFLNMDRPSNLMVVNGLMWFDEEPDWAAVKIVIAERLVGRFPVLSCHPVLSHATWMWQDDPGFDLDRHVRRVDLAGTADLAAAQEYISERVSQPLDREHPLWEVDCVSGLSGADGEPVALVFARFHHALADGIRIVQLVLSLCDVGDDADATPPTVGRAPSSAGLAGRAFGLGLHAVGDAVDFAGGVASAAASLRRLPAQIAGLRPSALEHSLGRALGYVATPTAVTDAVTGLASQDNQLVNSVRSASRLTLAGRSPQLLGDSKPAVAKRVSWVTGIDLATVKAIGARHGATVNDVLLAAVSRGLARYVQEKGREPVEAVNWLVPISLKPIDADLPTELGNHFAMVIFPMPLDGSDDERLMQEIRSRMTRTKNSAEAMMVFALQRAIAETPAALSVGITDFVANKTVGVLTNVPGPATPIYLAGSHVSGLLGWVPTASDQWLGICIFSYDGMVSLGITSDAELMPDPDRL